MYEPARKRRRTSGEGADDTADARAPSSPSARPQTRKRPSYASPTKASMSRHNPQILERRASTSPTKEPGPSKSLRRPNAAARRDASSARDQASVDEDVAASEPQGEGANDENGPTDPAGPRSESSEHSGRSGSVVVELRRRSPIALNPRPLPPPAPEGEDELDPFIGRTLRRSPTTGVRVPRAPEPELPPSSDPVSSTPPRGIHSSPVRWKDRTKPLKSSPLKPRAAPPSKTSVPEASSASRNLFWRQDAGTGPPGRHRDGVSANPDPSTDATRQVSARDPHTAKRRETDALRLQIESLEKDLEVAEGENERIRVMQSAGRNLPPSNGDELVALLWRHLIMPPENKLPPLQSQMLVRSALGATGLLPFSKPKPAMVAPAADSDDFANIKSHHPVTMSAEEEAPYLRLFSAFDATSDVAMLAPIPGQAPRQRHAIRLRSRDAPALFSARLDLVVDAMNLTILEMNVKALEPAARAELSPFLERICSGDCNRSMQHNVGTVSWAMGEWVRVATQRARAWLQLERSVGSKERLQTTVSELRRRRHTKKTTQEGSDDEDNSGNEGQSQAAISARNMLSRMDQQWYELHLPSMATRPASIRLGWKIGFDWTGEAQSSVSVMMGAPGKWHDADSEGALGGVPKLFGDLVEGGQVPATAMKTIVALLAGESL